MMNPSDPGLNRLFAKLRRSLFPHWKEGRLWKVRAGMHPGCPHLSGYCDDESRTLWIDRSSEPDRTKTVVHEMVHAVTGIEGHDDDFLAALAEVASKTTSKKIRAWLTEEHDELARGENALARGAYDDAKAARGRGASYEDALLVAERVIGLTLSRSFTIEELLEQYPRLRTLATSPAPDPPKTSLSQAQPGDPGSDD
jgi:hypothetical protein